MIIKIIIKSGDFDREILSFLTEIGGELPVDWNIEALEYIREAVIDAFEKMGIVLEIDERLQPSIGKWWAEG
jgi:hypothetical protein